MNDYTSSDRAFLRRAGVSIGELLTISEAGEPANYPRTASTDMQMTQAQNEAAYRELYQEDPPFARNQKWLGLAMVILSGAVTIGFILWLVRVAL